jgi:hypothetical protein
LKSSDGQSKQLTDLNLGQKGVGVGLDIVSLHLIRQHRLRCRRNWLNQAALNTRREFVHRGELIYFDRFRGPGALQAEAPVF